MTSDPDWYPIPLLARFIIVIMLPTKRSGKWTPANVSSSINLTRLKDNITSLLKWKVVFRWFAAKINIDATCLSQLLTLKFNTLTCWAWEGWSAYVNILLSRDLVSMNQTINLLKTFDSSIWFEPFTISQLWWKAWLRKKSPSILFDVIIFLTTLKSHTVMGWSAVQVAIIYSWPDKITVHNSQPIWF